MDLLPCVGAGPATHQQQARRGAVPPHRRTAKLPRQGDRARSRPIGRGESKAQGRPRSSGRAIRRLEAPLVDGFLSSESPRGTGRSRHSRPSPPPRVVLDHDQPRAAPPRNGPHAEAAECMRIAGPTNRRSIGCPVLSGAALEAGSGKGPERRDGARPAATEGETWIRSRDRERAAAGTQRIGRAESGGAETPAKSSSHNFLRAEGSPRNRRVIDRPRS